MLVGDFGREVKIRGWRGQAPLLPVMAASLYLLFPRTILSAITRWISSSCVYSFFLAAHVGNVETPPPEYSTPKTFR